MGLTPEIQEKADEFLFKACGKHWDEMTKDDWIDPTIWETFMADTVRNQRGECRTNYMRQKRRWGLPVSYYLVKNSV
ncbi:Uncharacterized protein dnm_089920 [Desulfonema magnum]|uniref:Uncharacterized protein n=1 Tax=Desulfonema magnum TaxID=45655 RepID=A0A975BWA1_9BACT|nr:Uncharacterized protein dnm_089920 [Desulfonema magnum]